MTGASEPEAGGHPVGPVASEAPAPRPGPVVLEGRFGRVEKLDERHAAALWDAVNGDDTLWTYLGYGPFPGAAAFAAWVAGRVKLDDPYSYAIVDGASRRAVGIATLMEIRPAMRVIEVGHIVYGTPLQRTPLATEAQYLLAHYAFETLGYRRYEWKCNALNAPSRAAAMRFGFAFEGIFRQHMIVKGRSRDTAWYSMLDSEWPTRKAAFERWLAPDNFAADGSQRTRLSVLNQATAQEGGVAIRRATVADQAALEVLTRAAFGTMDPILQRRSLALIADYGALLRDQEVWVIDGAEELDAALVMEVHGGIQVFIIAVAPAAQARGLGETMLNFAEHRAKALGFNALKVLGNENLTRQIGWYARRGYRRLPEADPRDPQLVHMSKTLG